MKSKTDYEETYAEADKQKAMTNKVNLIKKLLAAYRGESMDVYSSRKRHRDKLIIKHEAVYFVLKIAFNNKPYGTAKHKGVTKVGNLFGYNHANVLAIYKKICGFVDYDKDYMLDLAEIEHKIRHKILIKTSGRILSDEYYFIDLDNAVSMKLEDKKAIVLTGFDETEVEKIKNLFHCKEVREHKGTEMYFLETDKKPKQ